MSTLFFKLKNGSSLRACFDKHDIFNLNDEKCVYVKIYFLLPNIFDNLPHLGEVRKQVKQEQVGKEVCLTFEEKGKTYKSILINLYNKVVGVEHEINKALLDTISYEYVLAIKDITEIHTKYIQEKE